MNVDLFIKLIFIVTITCISFSSVNAQGSGCVGTRCRDYSSTTHEPTTIPPSSQGEGEESSDSSSTNAMSDMGTIDIIILLCVLGVLLCAIILIWTVCVQSDRCRTKRRKYLHHFKRRHKKCATCFGLCCDACKPEGDKTNQGRVSEAPGYDKETRPFIVTCIHLHTALLCFSF